ncbi:MAG: exodeoxyribonuclease V subunit gamma [Pseudomarimonas sp.]
MLHLTVSNRLEALADALAERLRASPLGDPLAAEHIVVPHSGVGRWLQLRLAQQFGVSLLLRFELPAQRIAAMLTGLPGTAGSASAASTWERSVLRWRLLEMLERLPAGAEFSVLRAYLADTEASSAGKVGAWTDPLKPWQLACRLADVLDAYQVYRPDWLHTWSQGRRALPAVTDEVWQAALWRRLCAAMPPSDRGNRMQTLVTLLENQDLLIGVIPQRLSLFGALPLSPMQMRWVRAVSRRTEVAVYHCAPSAAYWGDLRSPRELARQRASRSSMNAVAAVLEATDEPVGVLLASLGAQARDAQQLQIEHWLDDSIEQERWSAPDATRLLGWLQASMLELGAHTPPPLARGNLRIHACASARREVEVVFDELLDLFQHDHTLRPHEVVIMAPSLDQYAPLIEAVLAATPIERRIPITLADGRADRLHPLVQRYLWLLRSPTARFTRAEVLGLFEVVEIRARFELSDEGQRWLLEWAQALCVVAGLNADQRDAIGEGAVQAHTWAAAIERLLMGHATGDDGGVRDGVAPFAAGDGAESALALGSLWRLLRTLERWRLRLQEATTPATGVDRLRQLFDAFFKVDASDADAADAESAIRDCLELIEQQFVLAESTIPISLDVLVAAIEDALAQPPRWQRFLGEGATVCALVPLRSVPFRVIAVLGLEHGAFPRRTPPAGFDLMARAPRLGDRQPRSDDRQLLLDTLLAARDHLHLSYVGIDANDGGQRPPSPPLAEIIDCLRISHAERWESVANSIVQRHPLAPYAAESFNGPRSSFAAQWWPAVQAERAGWRGERPFLAAVPDMIERGGSEVVDVERLLLFYRNPARGFLVDSLRLSRARWIEDREGEEAQVVDTKAARKLLQRLLVAHLHGTPIADCVRRIAAEGQLPAGYAGRQALDGWSERFDAALNLLPGAEVSCRILPVDVQIATLPLSGQMSVIMGKDGPLAMGVDEPNGETLLALALARELLIQQGVIYSTAVCSYVEVPASEAPRRHLIAPLSDAPAWLTSVAEGWQCGQSVPLPLPARSGWAYARTLEKSGDPQKALSKVQEVWNGGEVSQGVHSRGESSDADFAIAFRGFDLPQAPAFVDWSMRIYGPLAAVLTTVRRK